jgi:hypothetical protein
MIENKDHQPELFEEFSESQGRRRLSGRFSKSRKINLTVTNQMLVSFIIALIIFSVIIFSLGVERGRRIEAGHRMEEPEDAQELKTPPAIEPAETKMPEEKKPALEREVYAVQVAAFRRLDQAEKEIERLKGRKKEGFILERGNFYVVYVGKFDDKQKAISVQKELQSTYKDCFIRQITIKE